MCYGCFSSRKFGDNNEVLYCACSTPYASYILMAIHGDTVTSYVYKLKDGKREVGKQVFHKGGSRANKERRQKNPLDEDS